MSENPLKDFKDGDLSSENYEIFDLHRPNVDNIVLVSANGEPMSRETDLIDVWFDSGAMPYAQLHYPFAVNKEELDKRFPADFIAEGVDQTRGWFFTLHAISTMLFDSVAFKNIISNGLVLDKKGNKMSKRLGNGVNPFEVLDKYGADAVRWYMISNSQPWDNLKFDIDGVDEVRRKFFGTLYNTYSFFSLYANVDGFTGEEKQVPMEKRPEIDRWIISLLNTLVKDVTTHMDNYETTPSARAISDFVNENLSNWYVRLNRRRFWAGAMTDDKLSAYQTLQTCLKIIAQLSAPYAPFISERLYNDITGSDESVHLAAYPTCEYDLIDSALEERMNLAQRASSMVLALRRKVNIKVRQPLLKMLVPILDASVKEKIEAVKELILAEVNVKSIEYIEDTIGVLVKKIKANFKTLGPKYSKQMKQISAAIMAFSQKDIAEIELNGTYILNIDGVDYTIELADVEITSEDIPGWLVASEGRLTIALDINISDELKSEGIARELINRIQNIRKDSGFDVTDKITIEIESNELTDASVELHGDYIASQTLATKISTVSKLDEFREVEIDEIVVKLSVNK